MDGSGEVLLVLKTRRWFGWPERRFKGEEMSIIAYRSNIQRMGVGVPSAAGIAATEIIAEISAERMTIDSREPAVIQ